MQGQVLKPTSSEEVKYIRQRDYNEGYRNGYPAGNPAYQPNNRNHPNSSWGNPNNVLQPQVYDAPTQAPLPPQAPNEPKKLSIEEMMHQMKVNQDKFIGQTGLRITQIEGNVTVSSKQVSMLENQVGLMANQAAKHKQGQILSNTEVNPRNNHCNAIQLHSGMEYTNHKHLMGDLKEELSEKEDDDDTPKKTKSSLPPTLAQRLVPSIPSTSPTVISPPSNSTLAPTTYPT